MPRTLILSDNRRETYAYARSIGLRSLHVEHATSASSIDGVHFPTVIELPSFSARRDRFAVAAAVRRMRLKFDRIKGKQIDYRVVDDFVHTRPPRRIDGEMPGQTTIDDFLTEPGAEVVESGTVTAPVPPKPTPPAKPRRAPAKKVAAKKAVAKPKPGSNALESKPKSTLDDFFGEG